MAAQSQNLVLKWKQDEQVDLRSTNQLRLHATYLPELKAGLNQTCLIYVPTQGPTSKNNPGAHFIAETILVGLDLEPSSAGTIIVRLGNTKFFRHPVPSQANGYILETGEEYDRRDYSREQKDVRRIERPNLQRIIGFGTSPIIMAGSDALGFANPRSENFTWNGAQEQDDITDDPRCQRSERLRKRYVQRKTFFIDQSRCILTRQQITFRNRRVGLQVAHLRPLSRAGKDSIYNTAVMHAIVHDLYDRFAFTFTDDYEVLWARDADPERLAPGLHIGRRGMFVRPAQFMPDIRNIRWHREIFFELEQNAFGPRQR